MLLKICNVFQCIGARPAAFRIQQVRDTRSIASPVRAAALDALEVIGPATVAELAEARGYPADGLYDHRHATSRGQEHADKRSVFTLYLDRTSPDT